MKYVNNSIITGSWLMVLLAMFIVAGATSCADTSTGRFRLDAFVDVSDPSAARIARYETILYKSQVQLNDSDRLYVSVFAHGVETIYDGTSLLRWHTFEARIAKQFGTSPKLAPPGTRIDLVLQSLADKVERDPTPCAALVLFDGGFEDRSPEVTGRIANALSRLVKAKHFQRLALVGLLREHRGTWEQLTKNISGKVVTTGLYDYNTAIGEVRSDAGSGAK